MMAGYHTGPVVLEVDVVAVHIARDQIAWFPLVDGDEPYVGAYVTLRAEDGRVGLARDGDKGQLYMALTGRVPAGTLIDYTHPGGVPADSTA